MAVERKFLRRRHKYVGGIWGDSGAVSAQNRGCLPSWPYDVYILKKQVKPFPEKTQFTKDYRLTVSVKKQAYKFPKENSVNNRFIFRHHTPLENELRHWDAKKIFLKKNCQSIRKPHRECCIFAVDLELKFIASKTGPVSAAWAKLKNPDDTSQRCET